MRPCMALILEAGFEGGVSNVPRSTPALTPRQSPSLQTRKSPLPLDRPPPTCPTKGHAIHIVGRAHFTPTFNPRYLH